MEGSCVDLFGASGLDWWFARHFIDMLRRAAYLVKECRLATARSADLGRCCRVDRKQLHIDFAQANFSIACRSS
jgi:hypothetical protein